MSSLANDKNVVDQRIARLRKLREARGLSLTEISKITSITYHRVVAHFTRGHKMSGEDAYHYRSALKCGYRELVVDEDVPLKTFADEAEVYATKIHGDQRYGEHPYTYHLRAVVAVLKKFGYVDDNLISAAWLHDSLEDTDTTYDELVSRFGNEIADLVSCVTDGPGRNRKERKAHSYKKMKDDRRSIAIKLADRIANVGESLQNNPKLFKMYVKERETFERNLLDPNIFFNEFSRLWLHLNSLFLIGDKRV